MPKPMQQQNVLIPTDFPGIGANTVDVRVSRKSMQDVTAEIVQNAVGSIGVGGLTGIASWQMSGADVQTTLTAAATGALLTFCASLAVRSFADETAMLARIMRKEFDLRHRRAQIEADAAEEIAALEGDLDAAEAEVETLTALTETLRKERDIALAEAQQLRAQLNPAYRPVTSLYDNVRRDAKSIIKMAVDAGEWIGRDRADLQWGKERWRQAQQLLQDAGIVQLRGRQVRILLNNLPDAYRAIDAYTGTIAPLAEAQDDDPTSGLGL